MKKLILLMLGVVTLVTASAQTDFFDQADVFFKAYVKDGLVAYDQISENPASLNKLIEEIGRSAKLNASSNTDKALLINAYNLYVIKGIVEAYPVNSPQAIPSFFDRKSITIAGRKISLNELEKEVLLKQTEDPRLHFVLVCAAKGCPKIISEAYRPENLEDQLDRQTRLALNDNAFTRVNYSQQSIELSRIFQWYRSDFLKDNKSIVSFLNKYRTNKIGETYALTYYRYDWTLNATEVVKTQLKSQSQNGSSNLLQFTPSQLFRKGQYEVNFFNNLYSQTSVRNKSGEELQQDRRVSILTSTLQFTYGVSQTAKVNIGADVVLAGGSVGLTSGNQFQLFGSNIANDFAVAAIGPRVKFQPFQKYQFFSIQSTLLFPVANDLEGLTDARDVFLGLNRYQWRTQFFYDFKLSERFRLFYDLTFNYLIRRNKDEVFFGPNFFDIPSTVFINYFPTDKLNFFVNGQYLSRYGNTSLTAVEGLDRKFGLLQWILQVGGGVKYQATPKLGFEVSYGNFVSGRGFAGIEAGAGEVVNFGVRFIH
ncbi:MAG: DUF547 domain-containing protein [Bacteroidota bacterium]